MPGYLDKQAPSIPIEFFRYVDSDILGKLLFKNFVTNILKLRESAFSVSLARHGERYGRKLDADAEIYFRRKTIGIEIKCSRLNICHPDTDDLRCWNFNKVKETDKRQLKRFDVLFAVGVLTLGLSEPDYWEDLFARQRAFHDLGRKLSIEAPPYHPDFLNHCGFFIIPFRAIERKSVSATVRGDRVTHYEPFFAWGFDPVRCNQLWQSVVEDHISLLKQTNGVSLSNQDGLFPNAAV
jgi:hypothetical protein